MKPGVSMPHSQGLSKNPYPGQKQTYSDTLFFKIHSIIVLPTTLMPGVTNLRLASHMRLFEGLFVALDKSK